MLILLISVLLPILAGTVLFFIPCRTNEDDATQPHAGFSRKAMCIYTAVILIAELALVVSALFIAPRDYIELFSLTADLILAFKLDSVGWLFATLFAVVWVCIGFYSFEYMKHEDNNKRYFSTYLVILGVLIGLCFAGNLITYYAFFELVTLGSFALVLHNQSKEAIMASMKYMFYSFAGAYMVLFGIFFVHMYAKDPSMAFSSAGVIGVLNEAPKNILMISMLLMIMGFGVKAGLFPMHGWLPTAHPVAPAPASVALSGIIVKAGVLGILRVIYYVFGMEYFSGSYVQTVVIILSLITVFIGSMLAFKEPVLKKRLAYSTVSQVSYILFGLFVLDPYAQEGSILHVLIHALIKGTLFLVAGAIIFKTGATRVDELRGIGRRMPITMWCYTIVSLGLIGIPPFGGFTSKWFLGIGAIDSRIPVFCWLGPVILLISALLTAGYLLPITINGFLPGKDYVEEEKCEPGLCMLIPIIIMTLLSVLIGLFPEVLL